MLRREHPNPQWERKNWENLNGTWQFEIDHGRSGRDRKLYEGAELSGSIYVPFCPESELSGVGNKDFMDCVWYRRELDISKEQLNGHVILHFGAVDYKALIYINGKEAGVHIGGYTSFFFDITQHLNEGKNVIYVCAEDDTRSGMQPRGKQSALYHSHHCDYTRTTGIWQTVWLEFVPKAYIQSAKYYPDIHNQSVTVAAVVEGQGDLKAEAFYEGKFMGSASVKTNGGAVCFCLALEEAHLWEPGHGRLYDLVFTFGDDVVNSYFGLRQVRLDGMKFLINEKSVFQRLVLDQGFYPDGIYTAPSDEALVNDIKLSMSAGFNGARLHEKTFESRFLYHCDKLGYLVWGEHANWGLDLSNPAALSAFLPPWLDDVSNSFNHPSIVGWCPFNETWDYEGRKQIDDILRIVYETTKAFDNTRPCIDTSGNYHVKTDIFDLHDYEQNVEVFKARSDDFLKNNVLHDGHSHRQTYNGQPCFISEYGGIKWDTSDVGGWGYGEGPKTEEELIARYQGLTDALLDNEKIFGFCYTQLYDVEQEVNGLYTYNREPKFDMEVIRKINQRKAAIEE